MKKLRIMNWYTKYKQAKALPESVTPYPEIQSGGLERVDKSLEQKDIEEIFGKEPTEFLGSGFYGGAWFSQGRVKKITKDSYEYNTALQVLRKQNRGIKLPFVVPVYSVRQLQTKPYELFEIVIGKAQQLTPNEKFLFTKIFGGNVVDSMGNKEIERMKKLVQNFDRTLRSFSARPTDVSGSNVGILNEKLVIIDLGAFHFDTETNFYELV